MEEIWKDVIGYEGYYQVSNLGRIRSIDREVVDKICVILLIQMGIQLSLYVGTVSISA